MVGKNGVHKVVYNGLDENYAHLRDYFIEKRYPDIGTTFVDVAHLQKTGRSLREDAKQSNRQKLKRDFFDIGAIDEEQENCHENGVQKKLGKMK